MTSRRMVALLAYGVACGLIGAAIARWWPGSRSEVAMASVERANGHFDAMGGVSGVARSVAQASAEISKSRVASPRDLVSRLAALRDVSSPQNARELIALLQRLRELGPAALPAIRAYLHGGQDIDFGGPGRAVRPGTLPLSFANPPSLRLGLLDVVKDIGGSEAENILVGELRTTGRGVEVAYLNGVLQQLAPDKYRDVALAAAHDLLAMPLPLGGGTALDRGDRDYIYSVLSSLGDATFVPKAQAELIRSDGRIDTGALQYLEATLGANAMETIATAWHDPRVAAAHKEPLARAALAFVGGDDRADALYRNAVGDPALTPSQRQNLIEDLNEVGFADPRHLTAADLPVIERRLALVEALSVQATDAAAVAGLREARKDLLKMRDDVRQRAPHP